MKIPKYWDRGSAEGINQDGETVEFSCFGWSDESMADARSKAQARAGEVLARFLSGELLDRYSYGERPMREQIVEAITDRRKKELALVTRNVYGALVVNAQNAMFMDVDFEAPAGGLLSRLFGKKSSPEQKALAEVQRFSENHPDLGLRVYRTFAGLRVLVTSETFDPTRSESLTLMRELNCDPLYVKLCGLQECFRARLTPKPWRCGSYNPPARWPFETKKDELNFSEWEKNYNRAASSYSVCWLVNQLGGNRVHPEIEPVLALHDKYCLKTGELALA